MYVICHLYLILTFNPFRFLNKSVLSKVDLPAPLAPIIAKNSPGLTMPLAETNYMNNSYNKRINLPLFKIIFEESVPTFLPFPQHPLENKLKTL